MIEPFAYPPNISQAAVTSQSEIMSLHDLAPANTQRALATALNVFKRFLETEDTTLEYVRAALVRDVKGLVFVKLMDRFAMHLAFMNGRGGQPLALNSIMGYYRNVKNWLLDDQPQHRQAVEKQLLKMARTLERHCLKRHQGGMVNKAPACTKNDLQILLEGLHYDSTTMKDYQDAAVLTIMWYTFGRSSDLVFVKKSSLSVASGSVLLLRLIRAKASEEQGLSLFPDQHSFVTCPLHAIAMALVMQSSPTESLLELPMLHATTEQHSLSPSSEMCLVDALEHCYDKDDDEDTPCPPSSARLQAAAPFKMQAYVNRVVKLVSERQAKAKPTVGLSSHSFRRGSAQHVNGDASLSPQWIFDRGCWNMTATNKAFAYVFNTTSEDMKVSKMLSGWKAEDNVGVASLTIFDSSTRKRIADFTGILFATSVGFQDSALNIDNRVADLLAATIIRHFPEFNSRHFKTPYAARVRQCLFALSINMSELLAWSVALSSSHRVKNVGEPRDSDVKFTREEKLRNQQNVIISELLDSNRELLKRIAALETSQSSRGAVVQDEMQKSGSTPASQHEQTKRNKAAPMSASSVWFEWCTKTPRLWEACASRQYKSTSKQIVAFMKLFLPRGFKLDLLSRTYGDDIMKTSREAETNMMTFLLSQGISRRLGNGLLKQLRELQRQSKLDAYIRSYRELAKMGLISDPDPSEDTFSKI